MEKCNTCGNTVDDFDICTHETYSSGNVTARLLSPFVRHNKSDDFESDSSTSKSVVPFVIGPLATIGLDLVLPTWSFLPVVLLLLILATVLVNTVYSNIGSGIAFNFSSLAKSLPRQIITPQILRLYSSGVALRKNIIAWTTMVCVSILIVMWVGLPGNSMALETKLQSGIKDKTGQNISVNCPSFFLTFPNRTTTCRANLPLGIKLPVRIKTDAIGNISWDSSLN